MIEIEIPMCQSWKAHSGSGRRSFNPLYKEKECFQYHIRKQFLGLPIEENVLVQFIFHKQIPRSTSKKKRLLMLTGEIRPSRPDVTNLVKFSEDCLKGIVIKDDCQVVKIIAEKYFAENESTLIRIEVV